LSREISGVLFKKTFFLIELITFKKYFVKTGLTHYVESPSNFVINALRKIEIEEMSIRRFMGPPELLTIQYLTDISPLPSPPRGEGRVRGPFYGCHGKRDA